MLIVFIDNVRDNHDEKGYFLQLELYLAKVIATFYKTWVKGIIAQQDG